ncbi:MAG: GNAT family N-acyltransferase [Hyphomicrobiaceae bacterium]
MISRLSFSPPLILQTQGKETAGKFPLDLKVFTAGSDRRDVYALRYRAFIKDGVITPRDDKLFSDAYDDLETTCTLAAYQGAACVGSFRLAFGEGRPGEQTMPCQSIFTEIGGLEAKGYRRLVEFGRMVVEPSLTNTSFRTTLYATLVRAGLIVAEAGKTDFGLISVHPKLAKFYELMCGFKIMARAETYPGINAPAVLLGRNFKALDQKRTRQNPFFRFTPNEVTNARAQLFNGTGQVAIA